jgi:hypothetical protein
MADAGDPASGFQSRTDRPCPTLTYFRQPAERGGGVFALDAALQFESPSDLQERVRRQAPQLVADMIERLPPAVRQQLGRRLGLGENGLPGPGVGNAVLLQLAQREAARRRAPPAPGTPGHSVSLDKAWHGLHYLLCGALEPVPGGRVRRE